MTSLALSVVTRKAERWNVKRGTLLVQAKILILK